MFDIKVINIKKVEGFKQLRGFAVVLLNGELTIRSIRILEDSNGLWIAFPQQRFEMSGKLKYSPIVETSTALKEQIRQAIVKTFNGEQ